MKLNNKGFSFVELLAVVAILGILSGIAIGGYQRYIEKAKKQSYNTLLDSSIKAAESYFMNNPGEEEVNFDDLVESSYLKNADDPYNKKSTCEGTVRMTTDQGTGESLDTNSYIVDICCANGNKTYNTKNGSITDTGMCMANFQERKYMEENPDTNANCSASNIKTKKINIYTMEYIDKVCEKKDGIYGACKDTWNNPCRRYSYHQYSCTCQYSKVSNKYCSSTASVADQHIMKIRYQDTANGRNACNSNGAEYFNSFVERVCTDGTYKEGKSVMTFHGYQFFKGMSEGYTNFQPEGTWFHDNISGVSLEARVQRKEDIKDASGNTIPNYPQGCRDTCVRFTEALSGEPK